MITKDEIQELLHSTETYRVERTTSTDERSKGRGQTRLYYALQEGRRREPTGDMDKFQEAICAFANDNGGNVGGINGGDIVENVVGKDLNDVEKPSDVVENKKNVVENILASISKNSTISTKELAAMCSLSERQVQRIMTKLKEQGVIRRIGPDKGGHWEIIAP